MTSNDPTLPDYLLPTKLYRPRIALRLVHRGRLLARLEQSANLRLTLISAPAGYGKTTLVDVWLEETERPYAWLSLDNLDNDLGAFLLYLLAAIRTTYPTAVPITWATVNTAGQVLNERLADTLLQELSALEEPLWLVIDDYHVIQQLDIHTFMARLVMNTPPAVHFVLLSRSDPPFPLARLRARRQLSELRVVDLRFDHQEIGLLLRNTVNTAVSDNVAALLEERTEGWPAGLQLAAISLRDSASPEAFAQRFAANSHRLVSEYLIDEVLATLSAKQRRELLHSSLPDRFCAPLFGALTGAPEIEDPDRHYLESLWRSNLFVVALDDEGIWYRYHTLFRMLLRQRLSQTESPAAIAALHARASAWFAGQGLLEEAIIHAQLAQEPSTATQLFEDHLPEALNSNDWRRLERWLHHFPADGPPQPVLLIARAFLHHFSFQHARILPLVAAAAEALAQKPERLSPDKRETYQGLLYVLRAAAYRNTAGDREEALAVGAAARRQLPDSFSATRSIAESNYILTLNSLGRREQALQTAAELLSQQPLGPDVRTLRLLLATCGIHFSAADLPRLQESLPLFHSLAQRARQPVLHGWASFGLGWYHYQLNDLLVAERYLAETVALRHEAHGRTVIDAYSGLTLTHLALGRYHEAQGAIAELRAFLHDRGMLNRLILADSLAVRLALARGEYSPARHSVAGFTHDVPAQVITDLWELPAVTAVRAYLARGGSQDLASAADLLAAMRAVAADWHNTSRQIELMTLEAQRQAACDDEKAALAALATAVRLAEPGGTLRLIADAGPALQPLLRRLLAQNIAPAYVQRLLAVFPPESMPTVPGSDPALPLLPPARQLSAALTNREIDVLLLLADRLTNKEIADRLSLSPNTVKKHTIHLYEKLGVKTRRQAVARAQALGLLPEGL